MNRRDAGVALCAAACLWLAGAGAAAQEIYKWTDASGKVHYGDRAAAPEHSRKLPVTPAPAPAAAPVRQPAAAPRPEARAKPVDPARVAPSCQGLIGQIAAVPPGKNWEALYRQFDSACPGIAYECVEYRSRPRENRCSWVERTGKSVLTTNRYP